MDNYDSGSVQNSIGQITRDFIQPRLRRRASLLFTTGIIANMLGSIFIGMWLGGALPSYGNETAWWGLLFSVVCSVGAFWLFDYSRNKLLRGFLSVMLAIFWGWYLCHLWYLLFPRVLQKC